MSEPPVDPSVLRKLAKLGALNREFLAFSRQELTARAQAVQQFIRAGDAAGLEDATHVLRGASGQLGATRVAGLCSEIETLSRTGRVPDAQPLAVRLQAELEAALAELERQSS